MKLGKRNLFYSLLLAAVMLLFLVGYFVCMLPSLYVDYTMEQNLRAVKEQHRAYVESGSYRDVPVRNPAACFSVKVPEAGESLFLTTKMFSIELVLKDERLKELYAQVRGLLQDYGQSADGTDMPEDGQLRAQFEEWGKILSEVFAGQGQAPFEVELLESRDIEGEWHGEYEKVHTVSDRFIVFEMGVEDANNRYANYIAVERAKGSVVFTFLPALTPDMNEIRPIVLQSLPMLTAVILLLVLLFSQIYSRGIVTPIVRLVQRTEHIKSNPRFLTGQASLPAERVPARRDEIGMLSATIDGLFEKIRQSYEELAAKNQALEKENERQEVLLRASSHQLKTPIAVALLLVDGMCHKVGKYQDTQTYLPRVKEQLLSMQRMVEDILYLNQCGEHPELQEVSLSDVLKRQLALRRVAIAERQLQVDVQGEAAVVRTDETLLSHILENLLSNAVRYTPEGGRIVITLEERGLAIQNYGAEIDGELLPHIFEPFVSGSHVRARGSERSHGLGLYIAAYYAGRVGAQITVGNTKDSVTARLAFRDEKEEK